MIFFRERGLSDEFGFVGGVLVFALRRFEQRFVRHDHPAGVVFPWARRGVSPPMAVRMRDFCLAAVISILC